MKCKRAKRGRRRNRQFDSSPGRARKAHPLNDNDDRKHCKHEGDRRFHFLAVKPELGAVDVVYVARLVIHRQLGLEGQKKHE